MPRTTDGVHAVYKNETYDGGDVGGMRPVLVAVFGSELKALRYAISSPDGLGYVYLPYGMTTGEALTAQDEPLAAETVPRSPVRRPHSSAGEIYGGDSIKDAIQKAKPPRTPSRSTVEINQTANTTPNV